MADLDDLRLLISDTDPTREVYDDGELAQFIALTGDPRRAAALALTTIAANEALLLKYITTRQLTLDGPKVARELREAARDLRAAADEDDARTDHDGAFEVVTRYQRHW